MSKPTKMTLLLTPAERARLDALRLARGDRSAAATLRALVRDAGGIAPRAPRRPSPDPLDPAEDDGADAFIEEVRHAATSAIEAELGHCLPQRPLAGAADLAELVLQALPRWAGLDPGGDPPDPLRPAHVRGAARAARALADALERIAERA